MTYQDFKTAIKNQQHISNYYSVLIANTEDLLIDIANRNQYRVAKDLNMTPVKLSHLLPLLKELYLVRTNNV